MLHDKCLWVRQDAYDRICEIRNHERELKQKELINNEINEINDKPNNKIVQYEIVQWLKKIIKGNQKSYFFKKNENEIQIKKDLINLYEEKKETIIGTEIKQIKYDSKYFTEDLFNLFKSDKHLSNFIEKNNYSDIIKDRTDISNDKEKDYNEIDR